MMPQSTADAKPSRWRERYPVHPCADVFPMMSEPDLEALAADIKAHGLQKPVVVWRDSSTQPHSKRWYVLDGRNRLAALERLGLDIPVEPHTGYTPTKALGQVKFFALTQSHAWEADGRRGPLLPDPAAYVISANILRRHLTKEQQAELIVKTIEAGQSTDGATVARSVKRGANGHVAGSTKDPMLAKAVTEAAKHGISKRTVQHARAKMDGKTPAPRKPHREKLPLEDTATVKGPQASVLIDSGPVTATQRLADVPPDRWRELVRVRRDFCAVNLSYDCRELLHFVNEAPEMVGPLGYRDVTDFVRRGLELNPKLVDWAKQGLKLLQWDPSHGVD